MLRMLVVYTTIIDLHGVYKENFTLNFEALIIIVELIFKDIINRPEIKIFMRLKNCTYYCITFTKILKILVFIGF